jgi:hypothetical protein
VGVTKHALILAGARSTRQGDLRRRRACLPTRRRAHRLPVVCRNELLTGARYARPQPRATVTMVKTR